MLRLINYVVDQYLDGKFCLELYGDLPTGSKTFESSNLQSLRIGIIRTMDHSSISLLWLALSFIYFWFRTQWSLAYVFDILYITKAKVFTCNHNFLT